MRILILGYGKMGKTIEQIALNRNHTIPYRIDISNQQDLINLDKSEVDVAIEFSSPESAFENIKICLEKDIPVVSGTTGWLEKKQEIIDLTNKTNGGFFYASNYSVGVNLFFHLNKILAKIMNNFPQYGVTMEEIHHTEKKDAPSGTAITLAEGIIEHLDRTNKWVNTDAKNTEEIAIISKRIDQVPGTHTVDYSSKIDTIEIKHTAHTREGFAEGAVLAAEWLKGKQGVFGMEDMLKFNS
jgi:4-hydroxy-tetrahydrodipicolinate reductase